MFGSLGVRGKVQSVPGIVAIAGLTVFSLLYLTATMQRAIIIYDEGLILFGAERVLNGDVPHRDFFAEYGPAQFYVLAGLYKLFGASVLIERALDSVERCACVVLVFVVVDGAAPRLNAILAALASLIWLQYFGGYGYPVFPALAAALGGLAVLLSCLRGTRSASALIAAGACAGVVALFRYEIGVATFAAECALLSLMPADIRFESNASGGRNAPARAGPARHFSVRAGAVAATWLHDLTARYRMRTAASRLIMFALGFAVVTVPVGIVFGWCGVIPDLVFDIFTTIRNYPQMRSMPFPRLGWLWANPSEFGVYLPLVVCAAAVPTMAALARRHGPVKDPTNKRELSIDSRTCLLWTLLILIAMTLVFYSKGLVHVSALFVSMGLITSLMVAGVVAQPVYGRGRVNGALVLTAVTIGGAATLCNVPKALHEALWNFEWARELGSWEVPAGDVPPALGSCRMPAGLERIACFKVRPDIAATVLYIEQRTAPADPVFVGLTGHDKISGNDILMYFLLNRPSATKWHQFDPGLQTSAPVQKLMVQELRRVRPRLIVLEKWVALTDPNESSVSSGVTLLDEYIRETYTPVVTFGSDTVLMTGSASSLR